MNILAFDYCSFSHACRFFNLSKSELFYFYEAGIIDLAVRFDGIDKDLIKSQKRQLVELSKDKFQEIGHGRISRLDRIYDYNKKKPTENYVVSGFWFVGIEDHGNTLKLKNILGLDNDPLKARLKLFSFISADYRYSRKHIKLQNKINISEFNDVYILNRDLIILHESNEIGTPALSLYNYPYEWDFINYKGEKYYSRLSKASFKKRLYELYRQNDTSTNNDKKENAKETSPKLELFITSLLQCINNEEISEIGLIPDNDYISLIKIIDYIPELGQKVIDKPHGGLKVISNFLDDKGIGYCELTAKTFSNWIKKGKESDHFIEK